MRLLSVNTLANLVVDDTLTDGKVGAVSWVVSVSFRKRPVTSRWADFEWETASVVISDVSVAPVLGPIEYVTNDETQWRYDGERIDLHHSEGEGYWLNLNSPQPCIFVMWRMEEGDEVPRPAVVTVSYNEAGRMLDAGDHVDNVPMPDSIRISLTTYTAEHYKPEPRKKVRRNDPFKEGAFRRESDFRISRG
jgi:Protein of unknown function (DUF3305)